MRQSNPYRAPHVCDRCGRETAVNLRRGTIYSHNEPDSTRVCPRSGKYAPTSRALVDGPSVGTPVAPPADAPRPSRYRQRQADPGDPSVSVRTLPGGLPGSARR